jgi:hypothetical protein
MPASDSGDDLMGIGSPDEGLGLRVVLFEKAVDRSLQIEGRAEYPSGGAAVAIRPTPPGWCRNMIAMFSTGIRAIGSC